MSESVLGISTHPDEPSGVANTSVATAEQSNQPRDPTYELERIDVSFASPINKPFGLNQQGTDYYFLKPALGDIDGDGDLDLFIGDNYGDTFYFENNGTANYPNFAPYTINHFGITNVGGDYYGDATPAVGDIDGDGDLDLFIGNSYGNTFYFENTGTATNASFAPYKENPFGIKRLQDQGASPALGDIDDDGDLDLFIGDTHGSVFYFQNIGSSTNPQFKPYVENPQFLGFANGAPSLGDVNNDGLLDYVGGNLFGNINFSLNIGSPKSPLFAYYNGYTVDWRNPVHPGFGDLDGDRKIDLLVGDSGLYSEGKIFFLKNTTPSRLLGKVTNVGAKAKPAFPLLNGDDDLDLFIGNQNGDIIYFENTAPVGVNPSYAEAVTNPFGIDGAGAFNASPAFVDVDHDGDQDLFLGNSEGDLVFYRNNASPGDQPEEPDYSLEAINPFGIDRVDQDANPALVDIDRDGDLDLFVGDFAGNTSYFLNTASPNQEPSFVYQDVNLFGITNVGGGGGGGASPAFHDIDQDGDLDLFIGNDNGDTFFFRNTASAGVTTPAFATPIENPFGINSTAVGGYAAPVFVDLLGDGTVDLLFGNQDGDIVAFRNKESGILSDSTGDSSGGTGVGSSAPSSPSASAPAATTPTPAPGPQAPSASAPAATTPTPAPGPQAPAPTASPEPSTTTPAIPSQVSPVLGIQPQATVTTIQLATPLALGGLQITQAVVGTDQRDTITGSNAGEAISGGKGRDQLTGGGGPDVFIFEISGEFGRRRADVITDYDPNEGDKLAISQDVFVGVSRIKFKAVTGKKEARKAGRSKKNFVYDDKKGMLYYDANGKKDGWGDGGEFARLLGAPELGKNDFIIA